MRAQDYFNLGCKLFGVYFLFLSVPHFMSAISTSYFADYSSPEVARYLKFFKLMTWILPLVYVLIGVALIRSSEKLFAFAYRFERPDLRENSEKFRLFLKMLGIYLFAEYLPDFIRSISSYFTYSNAPGVFNFAAHQRFVYTNFFPSIVAILLGIYLLRDRNLFVKLGFSKREDESDFPKA